MVVVPSPATFTSLPLEIRNEIYRSCLSMEADEAHGFSRVIVIDPLARKFKNSVYWGSRQMSRLLVLSRQINVEISYVIYTEHEFGFQHYGNTLRLSQLFWHGTSNLKLIRKIHVLLSLDPTSEYFVEPQGPLADPSLMKSNFAKFLMQKAIWSPPLWKPQVNRLQSFETLMQALPELQTVTLHVALTNWHLRDRKEEVIMTILGFAAVFKGVRDLRLESENLPQSDAADVVRQCRLILNISGS